MTFPCPKCGGVIKSQTQSFRTLKCRACHHEWLKPIDQRRPPLSWPEVGVGRETMRDGFNYRRDNLINEEE